MVGIEMETPIIAAIIGAFLGTVGTFLLRLIFDWRESKKHREKLRISLYEEIKTMGEDIDVFANDLNATRPNSESVQIPMDTLLTNIYESNADELGALSNEEVEKISAFYTQCIVVRRRLQQLKEANEVQAGSIHALRKDSIELHSAMISALGILEKKINPSESYQERFDSINLIESNEQGVGPFTAVEIDNPDEDDSVEESNSHGPM